jgi:hypothetical protein
MKRKSRKIKGGFIDQEGFIYQEDSSSSSSHQLNQTDQSIEQTGKDVVQTGKDIVDASIELVVSMKDLGVSIFKEIESVTHMHQEINNLSSQTSASTIPTVSASPTFTAPKFN